MENSASNTKININNKNGRSISVSSDSLDFFYSPYPFDSSSPLSLHHHPSSPTTSKTKKVLSTSTTTPHNSSALPLPLPLPLPPPPPPPSCWPNEEDSVEVRRRSKSSFNKQQVQEVKVKKVALGLRICQVILCFLSFFVMVSDKTRGWTADSYYRYPEYRYLVGVNIVGCIHSGVEACDMAYCLLTGGKHVLISCFCCSSHRIRYYLDFFIDQIVAYLLMSATSAAATRKGEWVSNWGKDEFTNMANASICLSFFAFFAFAFTCLFSALHFITGTT